MAFKNLREYIQVLDEAGELLRIRDKVDPVLEISEWADRAVKSGGPALLFENPKGSEFPVLINHYGTASRMARAMGVSDIDEIQHDIEKLLPPKMPSGMADGFRTLLKVASVGRFLPPKRVGKAPCQEVVQKEPDLSKFPILHCWPEDGGRFITLPMVVTRHPETGMGNVGMYRMQVYDKKTSGMHWHWHKDGPRHFQAYRALKKRMPVSVALGGDPTLTWAATSPCPEGINEFALAGFIRKKSVEMVRCLTNDLEVPAEAEIILEGYVDPGESRNEGPFGDHTGFYSLEDNYPVFHVTCITHRKNPIFPATIVGKPLQEDGFLGTASVRIFLPMIRTVFAEITDMDLPIDGIFHNLMIVSIKKSYPYHGRKLMNSLWGSGQMMFTKCIVVVDDDLDVHDYGSVLQRVMAEFDPSHDLSRSEGPVDALDHAARDPFLGGKFGIDATKKWKEETRGGKKSVSPSAGPSLQSNERQRLASVLKEKYPLIVDVNFAYHETTNDLLVVSIKKTSPHQGTELIQALMKDLSLKIIFVVDEGVNIHDPREVCWRVGTCIDPKYDIVLPEDPNIAAFGLDATSKLPGEGHLRPWPRLIVMSDEVKKKVDAQISKLGIEFKGKQKY